MNSLVDNLKKNEFKKIIPNNLEVVKISPIWGENYY